MRDQTFSTEQVSNMTGVSRRQLQWRDEKNLVAPVHKGHARQWSLMDIATVMVIGRLREKHISIKRIQSGMAGITNAVADGFRGPKSKVWLVFGLESKSAGWAMPTVFVDGNSDKALDYLCDCKGAVVINVSDVIRRVQALQQKRKAA
jgi:MerR HTH family regulatory protein